MDREEYLDPTVPLAKPCTRCGETKILDHFYRGTGRWGRASACKECSKAYNRAWQKANPVRVRMNQRRWAEKTRLRAKENQAAKEQDEQLAKDRARREKAAAMICGLCGEPARGWAFIEGVRYCHPGDYRDPVPTCYTRASWRQRHPD